MTDTEEETMGLCLVTNHKARPRTETEREYFPLMNWLQKGEFSSNRNCLRKTASRPYFVLV